MPYAERREHPLFALANIQQVGCFDDSVSLETAQKIADVYASCTTTAENAHLNEMGQQGWEIVNLSKLKATLPGGEWCRGVTVSYGFEVAWKRVK